MAIPRRELLRRLAAATVTSPWRAATAAPGGVVGDEIIDTHTHFYDPSRPQGVPWPPKDLRALYRTVLPEHYRRIPQPVAVSGTVVVEASRWVEDNQWILDLAARDRFIVGLVGHLPAGTPEFAALLARFAANPLFRGIRIGSVQVGKELGREAFEADMARLAERRLALDVIGPPAMLPDVARLARAHPGLSIVLDHVAGVKIDGAAPPAEWLRGLDAVAGHASICCKVSGLVEASGRTGGAAPRDAAFYRPVLDALWERLGPDRLVYASNWPVSELYADLATVQRLILDYLADKGAAARAAVLAGNSKRAYRWVDRARP